MGTESQTVRGESRGEPREEEFLSTGGARKADKLQHQSTQQRWQQRQQRQQRQLHLTQGEGGGGGGRE